MPLYNVLGNTGEVKSETPKVAETPKENWAASEIKSKYNQVLPIDKKPVIEVVKEAAKTVGISPALLMASAWQEGMNKVAAKGFKFTPEYYDPEEFSVDGFMYYGLDTFGDRYEKLKKYLPKDFKFEPSKGIQENGNRVTSGYFRNNKDALIAKSAMLKAEMDSIMSYAKTKKIALDEKAKNYFTMAAYNGGFGNAKMMMDQYSTAKDKNAFILNGETTRKGVHKNIIPRLENIDLINQIIAKDQKDKSFTSKQMEAAPLLKNPSKENPIQLFNIIK